MTKAIRRGVLALLLALGLLLAGCETSQHTASVTAVYLDSIPPYSGEPYIAINDNVPSFLPGEMTTDSYEIYSPLDSLGRCGAATACVGVDLMPTEARGSIGQVKPTGWQTVKYDCVDGKYLYNRCHLIGYQLSGENANKQNLITGTRYLNVDGMLPFENMVADYVKETDNHVLYRVTPVYEEDNLVASGVVMEAKSVEDDGESVSFNVYVYNVQPGVEIDYATGVSWLADGTQSAPETPEAAYILNTNSKKFHLPDCSGASGMKAENRQESTASRAELISQGYEPCGICKP